VSWAGSGAAGAHDRRRAREVIGLSQSSSSSRSLDAQTAATTSHVCCRREAPVFCVTCSANMHTNTLKLHELQHLLDIEVGP